MNHVFG
jgi:ribonuclease HI/transposase InsO family protein